MTDDEKFRRWVDFFCGFVVGALVMGILGMVFVR